MVAFLAQLFLFVLPDCTRGNWAPCDDLLFCLDRLAEPEVLRGSTSVKKSFAGIGLPRDNLGEPVLLIPSSFLKASAVDRSAAA